VSGATPPRPGWLLDELGSAGRENLDAAHVARYDGKEDAAAAAEVALLESLGMTADSTGSPPSTCCGRVDNAAEAAAATLPGSGGASAIELCWAW
jgi:hypothetical protein